ncbi:MAG TPA: tetraacyldisaccharide 4'-kinase [Chitinophagaceae bacterium]|nr:tetraacyldisaccharide 4'-kinase [Chitinophagaceae bacterium]
MNFNFPLLRTVRIVLFPLSLLYFVIIWIRNRLYDKGIIRSAVFNLPIICVGNLAVGGTGKSPMVEYLVRLLKDEFKIATLSRGYKRKTKGYALANEHTTALEIGDEPMQFHSKFPDVPVAVGEQRLVAIPQLLHDHPGTQAIILDDAFQHRSVKAGLNILLTDYSNLFTHDWFLPAGDLRDQRSSYKRAEIIVVTKCKPSLTEEEKSSIAAEIDPLGHQHLFFTTMRYGAPYHIIHKDSFPVTEETEVLLVTGIANPLPLKKMLHDTAHTYYQMAYNDHHIFTIDDLNDIKKRFASIQAPQKIILTTEKDAVRLVKFEQELKELPLYVIPIEPAFLFNDAGRFNSVIQNFIRNFKQSS